MNGLQQHVLAYMKEVVDQEDVYFYEAWKQVEQFVLDALSYESLEEVECE